MESLNAWPLDSTEFNAGKSLDLIRQNAWEWSQYFPPGRGTFSNNIKLNLGIPTPSGFLRETLFIDRSKANLTSLPNLLNKEGWKSYYLFGGSLTWENLGTKLKKIGFDEVHGEEITPNVDRTALGLHDTDLFNAALEILDKEPGKQYLQIMTLTNHLPYEIPVTDQSMRGLNLSGNLPSRILEMGKFEKRFKAYRFSVDALARFIELARQRPWFTDTMFIITADHGIDDSQTSGLREIPIYNFLGQKRIPLIMYAPDILPPPRILDQGGSHLDLSPTILSVIIQKPVWLNTFGKSLFSGDDHPDLNRITYGAEFVCSKNHCLYDDMAFYFRKDRTLRVCPLDLEPCLQAEKNLSNFKRIYESAGLHDLLGTQAKTPIIP